MIQQLRYPAFSTPTEEEQRFPDLAIGIRWTDSQPQFRPDDRVIDKCPPLEQAYVRQAFIRLERDFAVWASLSSKQRNKELPNGVVLSTKAPALVDKTEGVALAAAEEGTFYISYSLLREGVPVGFRLGVFEYLSDCLTRERGGKDQDEFLDALSLPLLADQANVLGSPERCAFFARKDWFDALVAHLAQKHPQFGKEAVSGVATQLPAPSTWGADVSDKDAELTEVQRSQVAELAVRRKVDQGSLLRKMRTLLHVISTGLGEDIAIKVVPGESWAYNYETNTITFPLVDLITTAPDTIVGFLLHEIGHYQITRVEQKNPAFARLFSSESLRLLLSAFEDPRVNNWMKATFRGTSPYFDLIYDDLLSEDLSTTSYSYKLQKEIQKRFSSSIRPFELFPHLEYLLSVLYFWRFGRLPPDVINSESRAALDSTAQYFESIFNHYPPGRSSEQDKLRYAREAAELILDHIVEPYEELLMRATANVAPPIEREQQPSADSVNPTEIVPQSLEREAQEILEEHAKELADRLSARRALPESVDSDTFWRTRDDRDVVEREISPEKPHSELTRRDLIAQRRQFELQRGAAVNGYHGAYAAVSGLLQMLVGTLENVLSKNRKPKYEGYFTSGQKPDLRRVMDVTRKIQQGLPTMKKDFDVFVKRRRPTHLNHRIMLLLDESGSMQEPKRTAALQALLLFMEAFDYLSIDYAIIGFSDAPIIHKPFGDNLTQRERESVFEDVSQFIPLGATADADALALGINLFEREPQDVYRLIIVISDGEGNVNTTGRSFKDLQDAAAKESIDVIGIGIGEQAQTVSTRYNRPMQVETVDALPAALGRVLQQEVVRDSSQ